MNNNNRRMNAGPRRNNRQSGINQRIKGVQNKINGVAYTPAHIPNRFVQFPWNSWTYFKTGDVESKNDGAAVVVDPYVTTLTDIASQIATAYATSIAPEIKIIRASSRMTASQTNQLVTPRLTTAFYEIAGYNSSSKSKRETITDQGTLNVPAAAGYVYPAVDQREILDATNEGSRNIIATTSDAEPLDVAGVKMSVAHKVYVLWRAKSQRFALADI